MSFRFDEFVQRRSALQANLLILTAGFPARDREDLAQEMILDCFRRSPRFDPARGDWRGFVSGVMRNHATVLVRRHRKRSAEVLAMDFSDSEDGNPDPLDVLDRRTTGLADSVQRRLDVRRVVEGLPYQLRSVAVLLAHMSVKEVCQHTGKSRSWVYQMTRQIREAFERAGFRHPQRQRRRKPK